uniref:PDZ domain-containing protein n=1 Tax=Panagrolaimus sp. JU765 TaxID=591449 RepID=A0AC34QTX9_9BILA
MVPYPANGRGYLVLPPEAPSPRLCLIQKNSPTDEYGFNLHAEKEKGQFIGAVDVGSPADIAGLKQGDLIFAVNGDSIIGRSHKEVVAKIKSNPLKCEMLVATEEERNWYQEHNIPIDMKLPNIIRVCEEKRQSTGGKPVIGGGVKPPLMAPPARISKLIKKSPTEEFGFNLHAERGKGHYIGSVDKNGIADRAGLVMGQRIVGVNGTLIYPATAHNEVVGLIKRDPLCTELLVVSEEVDHWYAENGAEFSFDNAVRYNSQPTAPQSTTSTRNHQVESRITMEKHPVQEETSDSNVMEYKEHQHIALFEPNNSIEQTTTMSTVRTVTMSEAIQETAEDTDDIIDKIFQDVPLIPVGQVDSHNNSMDTLSRDGELEHQPLVASESNNARIPPAVRESSSKPPTNQVPLVIKPVARTQSTDSKIPPSSPSSYASSPSPDPRGNGTTNGLDFYKLNAKEAQRLLRKQKNDPRKQNLSLEQKHQMVSNL